MSYHISERISSKKCITFARFVTSQADDLNSVKVATEGRQCVVTLKSGLKRKRTGRVGFEVLVRVVSGLSLPSRTEYDINPQG